MANKDEIIKQCNLFFKLARKADDLAILKANIGNYVHFSNSDRFGISYHKDIHPGNPRAIYGFPFTTAKYERVVKNIPDAFYDYGYSKYIYIFSVKGNILNIDNIDMVEMANKIRAFVRSQNKSSYHMLYDPSQMPHEVGGPQFLKWVAQIAKELFKNEHSGVNVLLRGIGYDAIETRSYGFGDDLASEIAVINPNAINLIAKINNPMLSKEQIKEIDYYNSDEYKEKQRKQEEERENKLKRKQEILNSVEEERKALDQMEQELRDMRRKQGPTPEYLEGMEKHLELTKKLNQKSNDISRQLELM